MEKTTKEVLKENKKLLEALEMLHHHTIVIKDPDMKLSKSFVDSLRSLNDNISELINNAKNI